MVPIDAPTNSSTSSDLLSLVRQHDADAWRRFVQIYAPLIYAWCRDAKVNATDAGDITQEVFAKVFTAIDGFRHDRPGDTLRGWLRVICRHRLADHYRSRGQVATGGSEAKQRLTNVPMPVEEEDPSTIISQRKALVRRAAELVRNEFEARTWQAFWLVTVEDRSTDDVAVQLGISTGAVRQAKYIVLRRLRDELSGEFDQ
ncbi:MAG TPA: sigma-70 family RNA polymerase sigma factor [Pirellulales bacterium]|nr:sigma-70 family RNA polymerase sigma factor [Pirellulales bacterium]